MQYQIGPPVTAACALDAVLDAVAGEACLLAGAESGHDLVDAVEDVTEPGVAGTRSGTTSASTARRSPRPTNDTLHVITVSAKAGQLQVPRRVLAARTSFELHRAQLR